jgi:hypothetical protein
VLLQLLLALPLHLNQQACCTFLGLAQLSN